MALWFRRPREISRILPHICSGNRYLQCRQDISLIAWHSNPLTLLLPNFVKNVADKGGCVQRLSTVSVTSPESLPEVDFLSFIESTFNDLEGPYHCWLNKVEDSKDFCRRNGVFLVLVGAFLEEPLIPGSSPVVMSEKVKSLQQR